MSRLERRIPFPVTIHLVPFSRKWNQLRNFEDIEKKRERTVQFIWQTRSLPSVVNLFHCTVQGPLLEMDGTLHSLNGRNIQISYYKLEGLKNLANQKPSFGR